MLKSIDEQAETRPLGSVSQIGVKHAPSQSRFCLKLNKFKIKRVAKYQTSQLF
jgi:hypothetical protein